MSELNSKTPIEPIQKPLRFWLGLFFLYLVMGAFTGTFISQGILSYIFNGNIESIKSFLSSPSDYSEHKVLYITVLGVSNLFSYFITSLLFLKKENGALKFQLSNPINSMKSRNNWWAVGLVLSLLPTVFLINDINVIVYDWVVNVWDLKSLSEDNAEIVSIYDFLISSSDIKSIVFSLVWLAIVPAIGEELVFRGILQNLFFRGLKNTHLAIVFSAFIFALVHFEFTGFITRLVIGVLFGYLYSWTKNIYVPIFSHLAFNASGLILGFLATNKVIPEDIVSSNSFDSFLWVILLIYTVLSGLLIKRFYQKERVYVIQMGKNSGLQDDA